MRDDHGITTDAFAANSDGTKFLTAAARSVRLPAWRTHQHDAMVPGSFSALHPICKLKIGVHEKLSDKLELSRSATPAFSY